MNNVDAGAPSVSVVPMTRDHIRALMRYEKEMFGSEAWSTNAYRDELGDTRSRYYRAAVDEAGELLAWAGIRVVGASAEVLTVGVIPAVRRRGIARRLLRALLAEAAARGARETFLEVRVDNVAARRFYEVEGFAHVGRRRGYYDAGRVDALVMRKELPATTLQQENA